MSRTEEVEELREFYFLHTGRTVYYRLNGFT